MPKLERKDFLGVVMLKDWMHPVTDRDSYRGFFGLISIMTDEEAVGFKFGTQESPWICRVVGDGEQWTFKGDQVRAVVAFTNERIPGNKLAPHIYRVP